MSFEKAVKIVYQYEGGYADDPLDMGRQTYRGISRGYNPYWPGWAVIDVLIKDGKKIEVGGVAELDRLADAFYRSKWDILRLGELKNSELAIKLYQQSILMGSAWSVMRLQEALNLYCLSGVSCDGVMGAATVKACNVAEAGGKTVFLIRSLKTAQISHHEDTVKRKPDQSRFLCGWSNRAWGD